MASARTVAVVVPSPATSPVLLATVCTSLAPMFSKGCGSSISLATVTPSLVTRGEPKDFCRTTFRPRELAEPVGDLHAGVGLVLHLFGCHGFVLCPLSVVSRDRLPSKVAAVPP